MCEDRFASSCLTALKDGTIGHMYETGMKSVFARFTFDWLTLGKDALEKKSK